MNVVLVATLVLPALGALAAVLFGRIAGTVFAFLTVVAAAVLPIDRATGGEAGLNPWHSVDLPWVPALSLRFHLGVDGISYPLVVLTALLTFLCCLYTLWHVPGDRGGRHLVALLLVIEVGIVGVFLALDLILFFVFFELVLLPMYAMIAGWGGDGRRRAARKFVLYTLFGSVVLLVGLVTLVTAAGTADLVELTGMRLSTDVQRIAFVLLLVGFAVKSPLWPLHTWLPDAHTEAPTVGSVILAGVLLKMGTYGLLRIAVGAAPEAASAASPFVAALAVAAIIVGGLVCLAQTELKRLIAYSSVGHMGFVLLGIATLTSTGLQAALIGNLAHGVITGLLFFLAGAIKDRAHTGDLARLGGLRETAPGLAGLLGFAAIASVGLPGLAGFWGEAFAVVAAVERGWTAAAVLAALGAALAAAYFLRLLRRVTHGPGLGVLPALRRFELASWGPLVVLALALGLVPALALSPAAEPVRNLLLVVSGAN
ncbi:NADH-quinone oxidoreductase subunit M [Virgisporangium ochraceum]|uniref:NADH-quinone oxidoreductase subunit M n=1 Tax=Virgisporangium ochraceum TaxID=65505 RepID=A0A8J4EB26_9ACTN|nr:NADH-quinone oxidoreductase subunit M [Virgisporangium ochraceum]GIJ65397.1 NADH-quinone oxidoreductase subunit M [Virgisporangium ochraceum]